MQQQCTQSRNQELTSSRRLHRLLISERFRYTIYTARLWPKRHLRRAAANGPPRRIHTGAGDGRRLSRRSTGTPIHGHAALLCRTAGALAGVQSQVDWPAVSFRSAN